MIPPENRSVSPAQFYKVGLGMFGGPKGSYGKYAVGSRVPESTLKKSRKR